MGARYSTSKNTIDEKMECKLEYTNWQAQMKVLSTQRRLWTCYFENKYYYAEASTWGDDLNIKMWCKTLDYDLVNDTEKCTDDCSICLSSLGKNYCEVTQCKHKFHTKCLEKYIDTTLRTGYVPLCPLCRSGNANSLNEIQERKNLRTSYDSSDYNSD